MLPIVISVIVVLLDQLSKYLIRNNFDLYEVLTIIPGFFNLRYIRNTGAAWGMFQDGTIWLSLLSVAMLATIIIFRKSLIGNGLLDRLSIGLICGGIVGNLLDRVFLRYVVDFLDFHWGVHHFPAFNVADSSICVGVFLYIIGQYLTGKYAGRANGETNMAAQTG